MISTIFTVSVGDTQLDKQATFAVASALTLTAKESQTAIIKSLESTFTIRNNWDKPSNAIGVRIQPATKNSLVAVVGTAAGFLEKFLRGDPGSFVLKTPRGEFLAIPTKNVRRTKRDLIQKSQRPQALIGKRDFIIKTSRGVRVLFQRRGRGKNSKLIALYVLVPRAKIKQQDVFFGVTERLFQKRFGAIYAQQLEKALKTAKPSMAGRTAEKRADFQSGFSLASNF